MKDHHRQFKCTHPGCDKVFNRRDYLERHATNHLSIKPYVCVQCNRHFSRKDLYDNHLSTKRHARVIHEAFEQRLQYNEHIDPQQGSLSHSQPDMSQLPPGVPNLHGGVHGGYMHTYAPTYTPVFAPINTSMSPLGPPVGINSPLNQPMNGQIASPMSNQSMNSPAPTPLNSITSHTFNPYMNPQLERYEPRKFNYEMDFGDPRFQAYGVSPGLSSPHSESSSDYTLSTASDKPEAVRQSKLNTVLSERVRSDMQRLPVPYPSLRNSVEEEQKLTHTAKTPADAILSISGDSRYAWFFDDKFFTESAKLGYDRCYSLANNEYTEAALSLASGTKLEAIRPTVKLATRASLDSLVGVPNSIMGKQTKQVKPEDDEVKPVQNTLGTGLDNIQRGNLDFLLPIVSLSRERALQVLTVLHEAPEISSLKVVDDWILSAWQGADAVKHIVHSATFDANNTHLALLAVLALVGMALSEDKLIANAARRCHSAVFLYAYSALEQVPSSSGGRLEQNMVNSLQAFSLLLRYDRLVLIGDSDHVYNSKNISAQYVTDLFLGKVLAAVPHIGEFPDAGSGNSTCQVDAYGSSFGLGNSNGGGVGGSNPTTFNSPGISKKSRPRKASDAAKVSTNMMLDQNKLPPNSLSSPNQQPIWATLTSEAYMFHQGAEPDLQWREWVLIESCKRIAHLSLYLDSIVSLSKASPNPVLISNMDIHMVCPDPLWKAPNATNFLGIAGPSQVLSNVPYLGLIKSLIRFPRAAQIDESAETNAIPWSIFALKAVAHGLIILVGKISGLIPYGDQMLQAVMQSRSNPKNPPNDEIFSKFDRQLQARLYRGLDVWHHYFTAAYGDVMERILRLTGSMSIPVSDTFDPPTEGDEDVPQYALVIVLCHYSSFIYVHEDLPVVLQVTTNLKQWLETSKSRSLQMLLDYLYMPLYTNWIRTPEAKGMVSAASLYLAWTHAVTGQIFIGNHIFLSVMIYIAVIVVWLYDFANAAGSIGSGADGYSELRLDEFAFMDDAIDYIHEVYNNLSGKGPKPKKRAVTSLILLAACLLYKRKGTKPLVDMLIQLLIVMDGKHDKSELFEVVEKSRSMYEERVNAVNEARNTRRFANDEEESPSVNNDNDSVMADVSDIEDSILEHQSVENVLSS